MNRPIFFRLPEPLFKMEGLFTVVPKRDVNLRNNITVEETVEEIVGAFLKNPRITSKELQQKTGLSRRGVEYYLNKLKNEGVVKRVGSDRSGKWIVLDTSYVKRGSDLGEKKTVEKTVEEEILEAILSNASITTTEFQEKTGLSRRGVEYNLDKLKKNGIIERVGSTKKGKWVVIGTIK